MVKNNKVKIGCNSYVTNKIIENLFKPKYKII